MASVNAKINGQFVKIPNYTSADADQIPYDESRNFREGYIGKEIKDLNSTVATHSQEIVIYNSRNYQGLLFFVIYY